MYFISHLFSIIANFYYIKSLFVTITLNDASVDIVDDLGSFHFSPEVEFTSPLYAHITLQ